MASTALITTEPEHIKERGVLNVSRLKYAIMAWILFATALYTSEAFSQTARWSEQKANEWYARQPWLVGSNYIPRTAINELEMWQEATFDPAQIDKELAWAEAMGMNTMRVFLHDLLWLSSDNLRENNSSLP